MMTPSAQPRAHEPRGAGPWVVVGRAKRDAPGGHGGEDGRDRQHQQEGGGETHGGRKRCGGGGCHVDGVLCPMTESGGGEG